MKQTELNTDVKLEPPYNGQFWCWYRQAFFTWPEYISWFRGKNF